MACWLRERRHARVRREQPPGERGVALITTIMILLLVGATALTAIGNSEEELKAGGRSRSVMQSLYAAEAGVQVAQNRIQVPRDLSSFSIDVGGITVESRAREDSSPQDISEGGLGKPPSGYSINVGSGYVNEVFQADITATGTSQPTTELEVRMGLLKANSGSY